jgi:hypothetical protein
LIAHGHADQLYDDHILARDIRTIVGRDTPVYLEYFYGSQVAVPLAWFPFLFQAEIWAAVSMAIYFGSVSLIWKRCARLRPHRRLVTICALAFPPLFHFWVRGHLSAIVLACFTADCLAFFAQRNFLAGGAGPSRFQAAVFGRHSAGLTLGRSMEDVGRPLDLRGRTAHCGAQKLIGDLQDSENRQVFSWSCLITRNRFLHS